MRGLLKRLLLVGLVGVIFLGGVYGVIAYRYWNDPPKVTRNYAAELNAPILAGPVDQRAWPIYREALLAISSDIPQHWLDNQHQSERVVHVPEVTAYVERQEPTLLRVRQAAKLPSLGYTLADQTRDEDRVLNGRRNRRPGDPLPEPSSRKPSENPLLMNVLLTAASEMRDLSSLLEAHALLAAKRGDIPLAADDLAAQIGLSRQVRETPLLVNDLISFSIFSSAMRTWGYLMETMPDKFTAEQLQRLEREAMKFCDGKIRVRLEGERANFADLVQRVFTDDGQGDGYGYASEFHHISEGNSTDDWQTKLIAPISQARHWSRRRNVDEAERLFELLEKELDRPYWECDCDAYEREIARCRTDRGLPLVNLLMPALNRVHATQQDITQQRDTMLTASALLRYRLEKRAWPKRLDELIPGYLTAIPPDQLTGKPLSYRLSDDGPVLYSVGHDKHDDGARAAVFRKTYPSDSPPQPWHFAFRDAPATTTGDLVLWPVMPAVEPLDPDPPSMRVDQ